MTDYFKSPTNRAEPENPDHNRMKYRSTRGAHILCIPNRWAVTPRAEIIGPPRVPSIRCVWCLFAQQGAASARLGSHVRPATLCLITLSLYRSPSSRLTAIRSPRDSGTRPGLPNSRGQYLTGSRSWLRFSSFSLRSSTF